MPYIGKAPVSGGFHKLDNLTASATDTYALTLGSAAYYPETANQLLVSLNGVIQAPQDSFTVSGSNLVFDSALTSSDSIDFVVALGDVLGVGSVTDGAITTAKIGNNAVTKAKIGTTELNLATIKDSTGTNTAMTIDSSGRVTMPYQPCFHAYKSDGDISSATPVVYVFNNAIVNVGNHYSTSTGRYTAGVAGNYHFSCQILNRNTTLGGRMHFYKNGSPYFTVGTATSATYNNVSGEATLGASAVIYLAAGDYVEIKVWAANGDFYGSGNCHNSFSGFLIG